MSEVIGAMSVKTTDVMSVAYSDAMARVEACVYTPTLIDKLSTTDWKAWDASGDNVLVCDADSMHEEDVDDDVGKLAA